MSIDSRNHGLFRRMVDPSPARLVILALCFGVVFYAGRRLLAAGDEMVTVVVWFAGAAVVHDLVLLPGYSLADRVVRAFGGLRWRRRHDGTPPAAATWINFVRVPGFLSGLLLLVWFPAILRQVDHYEASTGLAADVYPQRWLVVTAALFGASALWFVVTRVYRRARRQTAW